MPVMEFFSIIVGAAVGIGVLVLLFGPIFGNTGNFWECVRFWFTPDTWSLFRGEWAEDWLAEMRLGAWLFFGGGCGYAVYWGLSHLLT
jgi:hypothetical protein